MQTNQQATWGPRRQIIKRNVNIMRWNIRLSIKINDIYSIFALTY